MFKPRHLIVLPVFMALSACAYVTEGSYQNLTVLTPGAEDAQCHVYIDGLRYVFQPPQTASVLKSPKDMLVDCLAPGNRRKKLLVEAEVSRAVAGNVVTGVVPGAGWDYASGAMFRYPDIIEVNFFGMAVRPESLPAQNNPDIRQPEDYDLEEFKPGQPRLNEDRYNQPAEIRRRERGAAASVTSGTFITEGTGPDKGALMNAEPSAAPPSGGPVPLYPGE